jgi:hypothetical protein
MVIVPVLSTYPENSVSEYVARTPDLLKLEAKERRVVVDENRPDKTRANNPCRQRGSSSKRGDATQTTRNSRAAGPFRF